MSGTVVSRSEWDKARTRAYELIAHIEQGHNFRVSDDVAWLDCTACSERIPNDATFNYQTWCPKYWGGDGTLRPMPDEFVPYPQD